MTRRVLVVGDIATDVLAVHSGPVAVGTDTPARISLTGGGSAANLAAWLAGQGVPVTLAAVVGDDAAGTARLAELAGYGVRCAVRRSTEAPTGTVVVLSAGGDRSMLCDRGANLLLSPADVAGAWTGDVAHVHVSGYALLDPGPRPAARHALALATARAVSTSVDAASMAPIRGAAGFLGWVRGTDLLLANLDEARALLGQPSGSGTDLAPRLLEYAGRAVVTCGSGGAVWASRESGVVREPAHAVRVLDPTGAGDAFAAGLLAAWLAGADPATALRAGAALGARAVGQLGGRP
jgi:ribokinase